MVCGERRFVLPGLRFCGIPRVGHEMASFARSLISSSRTPRSRAAFGVTASQAHHVWSPRPPQTRLHDAAMGSDR
jgi:hypothetical protein